MVVFLLPKSIILDQVFALDKDDVFPLRADVQVAILATYRAIAADDLLAVKRREFDSVLDGCTMTICIIPDFRWIFRGCHNNRCILWPLSIQADLAQMV